jgi:hypothetical protein
VQVAEACQVATPGAEEQLLRAKLVKISIQSVQHFFEVESIGAVLLRANSNAALFVLTLGDAGLQHLMYFCQQVCLAGR